MPKRNRGKNAKKGNEISSIPLESGAIQSDIPSEMISENKASTEEKSENITSETLQVVKKNGKNQAEIQNPEKQNDNVQPKLADPQCLESKPEELGKPNLENPAESSASKQEPQTQSAKKSEQTKSANKSNKQPKIEQKKSEANSEVKSTESVNDQRQNKPGNQSETKQPDQPKKAEQPSPSAKHKENNKRLEILKANLSSTEKTSSESQEKNKSAEQLSDQTKSGKPNNKQTQSTKSETKLHKLSSGKEQQTQLIKQGSKQCFSEKNNDQVEESGTQETVFLKDEIKENKSAKKENKKNELPKQHVKKVISPKPETKKTDVEEVENKLPEININNEKFKSLAKQNTPAKESAKQPRTASPNIKVQNIVKDNEQGTTQVFQSDVSVPTTKKTNFDNQQPEVEVNTEKLRPSDRPTASTKKGAKPGGSSARENVSAKETVLSKTEPKQSEAPKSDAKPEIKKASKQDIKHTIPNKSNNKKVENKKLDSKQAPQSHSVKLDNPVAVAQPGTVIEASNPLNNEFETNNLPSTKPETKEVNSKEAELSKSGVNLAISNKNAETVELNTANNQSESKSQKQCEVLLLNTDLKETKQTDLSSAPSEKAELCILDEKRVTLEKNAPSEDVNVQAELLKQLAGKLPQEECYKHVLEQGKSNILGEQCDKPAELKEGSSEVSGTPPSLPPSGAIETKSSAPFVKDSENIQQIAPTNEIKIPHSNRVAVKTEPLTYAQVAEIPKVENKTKLAEEQTNNFSNSSVKQDDEEVLKEAVGCSLPNPLSQEEPQDINESSTPSTPKNVQSEKRKSNDNKEAKAESTPEERTIESSSATNTSVLSSVPEAPQVQEIPQTPNESQEESVNVQELTEHVMNILNEGGTDQHDLLKKNVELQQFIVKLIHLLKEKTDLCANLDRQNSALTSQSKSLKDVIAITKDLLGIRNLEVDRLHGDLNMMENAIKEERTRHNTALQHLTEAMGINDKLKKEYHIQMDLFEKLKEKYTEKVVILTKENMRMKALLQQHGIDPSAIPECMLPIDPDHLEPSQTETVEK